MTVVVRILGPVEAHRYDERLNIGGARQRRLLAHLALSPHHTRGIDGVIAAMWPDQTGPLDTKASVHTAVSRLRHVLGDATVVTHGGGYALQHVAIDAQRFEELTRHGCNDSDPVSRVQSLRVALRLWRGAALEEFSHEEWARPDAVKLDELRAYASEQFGASLLAAGRVAEAVAEMQAAAVRSPIRERTHQILMDALDQNGRPAEALRQFQAYRFRLATDVGLDPGAEIRALESAIATGATRERPPRSAIEQAKARGPCVRPRTVTHALRRCQLSFATTCASRAPSLRPTLLNRAELPRPREISNRICRRANKIRPEPVRAISEN